MQKITMGTTEWGLLAALSILWGGSFFFVEVALRDLPPLTIVALRVGLAALALHGLLRLGGGSMPVDGATWRAYLTMGLLNNVIPFSLIVWGQSHISGGLAAILNATTPIFTVVAAHVLTDDEKLSGARTIGVGAGFVGVVVLVGADALDGIGVDLTAQLAVLAAAASYALAGIYGRRFKTLPGTALTTATGQVTAATVLLVPLALLVDRPWQLAAPGALSMAAVAGLALLSTALAYLLYFRILRTAGATNLLLVTFLIPVSALILGRLFLGETLEREHLVGMGLIGLGLVAIDGRLFTRFVGRGRAVREE